MQLASLLEKKNTIGAITVGNSLSHSIDRTLIDVPTYHLWHAGDDLYETEVVLENVVDSLPALKTVFLAVSFQIASDFGFWSEKRATIYHRFPNAPPIHGDWKNYLDAKLLRLNSAPKRFWEPIWSNLQIAAGRIKSQQIYPSNKNLTQTILLDSIFSRNMGDLSDSTISREILKIVTNYQRYTKNTAALDPHFEIKAKAKLSDIHTFLSERKIRLVLFTPPHYAGLMKELPEALINSSRDIASEVAKKKGIPYYDYSEDPRFANQKALFLIPDHLSVKGRTVFTEILIQSLKEP